MNTDSHSASDIRKILELKNIAVVGMSNTEKKPAHLVPKYLIQNGYSVIPVNPTTTEVLGRKSYSKVSDVSEQVDIVDVFRRPEDVAPVIDDVINKKGVKVIWMQLGIYNREAEKKAKENGMDVVYNRCMKLTLTIAAFGSTSISLAQNMSGGTPEKAKFPGNETLVCNATNTSITQGLSPNSTTTTG